MGKENVMPRGFDSAQAVAGQPRAAMPRLALARELGTTVRRFRHSREWSLQELAERARLSYQFLSEIETGKRNFSIVTLAKLAEALGVPVVALIVAPETN